MKMNLQNFAQGVPAETPVEEKKGLKKAPKTPGETAPKAQATPAAEQAQTPTLEERLEKLEALLAAQQETTKEDPTVAQTYMDSLRSKEEERRKARGQALLAKLRMQEQEAKLIYPKLSLEQEVKDPRFVELLKCGLDVRSAFEVVHKDDIITASMEYAAREIERMITNKILAGGHRPAENGGNHGPAVTKTDVKSMTRQERKELIRRVRAGEKITL